MRELTLNEVSMVSGGASNDCGGKVTIGTDGISLSSSSNSIGSNIVTLYEGLIESTSYMIERVAKSFR